MRFYFFLILAFSSLQAMSKAPPPAQVVAESMGVRTLKYDDEKRNLPVLVELWYPTRQTGPFDAPSDSMWVHPKEIRDVEICAQKHPLILMSHGHGGDRRDRSWLAEYLVRSGYIVASVEHHGNSWRSYHPLLSLRFWERARDVTYALDQLLKDPLLKGKIDGQRIGFVGYSLGGMTGLALGGAKAQDVKEVIKKHQKKLKELDPQVIERIDFSEADGSFADERIRAIVLLSPAAFVFPPQSLKNVKVPVALVASEWDEVLSFEEHALKIITHLVPAKLKLLRDKVSHSVFLNRAAEPGENSQIDAIQQDKLSVHKEVGVFVTDFFREQL